MCVCVCTAVRCAFIGIHTKLVDESSNALRNETKRTARGWVKWKTDALKKLPKKNRSRSWKIVFQPFDGLKRIYLCVALTVLGLNDKWTSTLLFRDSVPWQTENVSCQPLSYYIFKTRIYHSICSSIRIRLRTSRHTRRASFYPEFVFLVLCDERGPRCASTYTCVKPHSHHCARKKSFRSDGFLVNSIARVVLGVLVSLNCLTFPFTNSCEILLEHAKMKCSCPLETFL